MTVRLYFERLYLGASLPAKVASAPAKRAGAASLRAAADTLFKK
jgi:hypothetical protein